MNIIFFAQSRSLDVFYQVYLRLNKSIKLNKVGFYVSNSRHYKEFIKKYQNFENEFNVVKEWNIYNAAFNNTPDLNQLKQYEKKIGDPTLWTPMVTDRRLYMGKDAVYFQDYKPRYSIDRMLSIVQVACVEIEKLYEKIQPDLVITHYTPTYGDCLAHMFAKANGVTSLDLRLSRLENYVMAVEGINEPPPHISKIFQNYITNPVPEKFINIAKEIIEKSRTQNALYEGVVKASKLKSSSLIGLVGQLCSPKTFWGLLHSLKAAINNKSIIKNDPQVPDPFRTYYFKNYKNKFHAYITFSKLSSLFVQEKNLKDMDFVLYPLHTEPELVLAQFSRPYLNQIEVIRNIALSLPIGMRLFVKEHPLMYERRPLSYYKKILQIPNVSLLDFSMPSEIPLKFAKMVIIIRGAIGLEAVINKIPVISLGKSIYDLLPQNMFRRVDSLYQLSENIFYLLENYQYDENELVKYISSVISGSTPINLMTDLLGKKGRHRTNIQSNDVDYTNHPHFDLLADYILTRIQEIKSVK